MGGQSSKPSGQTGGQSSKAEDATAISVQIEAQSPKAEDVISVKNSTDGELLIHEKIKYVLGRVRHKIGIGKTETMCRPSLNATYLRLAIVVNGVEVKIISNDDLLHLDSVVVSGAKGIYQYQQTKVVDQTVIVATA